MSNTEKSQEHTAPPVEYADCNGWVEARGLCHILVEPFCITRGTCKFYKAKQVEHERTDD